MTSATPFSNEQLSSVDIPTAEELRYDRLHARHSTLLILESLLVWLVPTAVFTALNLFGKIHINLLGPYVVYALPLVALPFIFILSHLHAQHCGYAVREQDIFYKSGMIWQKRLALPYCRIQHVEIERNPFERLLGLATLKFFTAGGGSADMKIPALDVQAASKLKTFVLSRAGDQK